MPSINAVEVKWRTGRKNHRVIYAQVGIEVQDTDPMIGAMDNIQLAREAVSAHNARLDGRHTA